MTKQLEIGLKSGTVIYVPLKEEDDGESIAISIMYSDYLIQLSTFLDVDKDYYIRKDCIEYITVNSEPEKKPLME